MKGCLTAPLSAVSHGWVREEGEEGVGGVFEFGGLVRNECMGD